MSTKQSRIILPTIALALMTVVSAVAGLNVALPLMAVDIGASQTDLTWIVDSYTVVFAGLLLLAGAIGDKYGRQRILLAGLVIFVVAAAFGFFQTTPESLIAARVMMGIGAAAIMPSTLSVITASFPPKERGRAVGVWVGVAGGGAVIGIFGSAILLEFFDWNSFFALNITLGLIAIVGTTRIPNSRDEAAHRLDWTGGLLSVVAVAGLVYAIIQGAEIGWDAGETITAVVIGSAALIGFVLWELFAKHPLLDPRLFKLRGFSMGSLSVTLQFFGQFGFIFVGMQYLQFVAGFSPLEATAHLLWLPLVVIPGSRVAGILSQKVPQKILGSIGLGLFSIGLFIFSNLQIDFDYWFFTTGVLFFGFGMALAATPATVAITAALPKGKQGVASAVNDVSRELGSALGIAILGASMNAAYKSEMESVTVGIPADLADKFSSTIAFTQMTPPAQLAPVWDSLVDGAMAAYTVGVGNSLSIAAWVALGGAVAIAVFAPNKIAVAS
jgi:EmrB/QacA subfamily drug resistance transporter